MKEEVIVWQIQAVEKGAAVRILEMNRTRLASVVSLAFVLVAGAGSAETRNAATADPRVVAQIGACPDGYHLYNNGASGLYCAQSTDPGQICPFDPEAYTCGPGAKQCCDVNRDNPCMPGWSACMAPGALQLGSGKTFCCPK
jgi:hypothetical protein